MRIWTRKMVSFLLALTLMTGCAYFTASGKAETAAFMHTIPVVMITADENDLWNETDGMLVEGERIDKSSVPFRNAVYRESGLTERPGHIRLIMPDGTVMLDQDMTFSLYGLYMGLEIDYPQKPLEIHALPGEAFEGKLFDGSERQSFSGLVLSNSGCDFTDTNLRDVYVSLLLDAYDPAVLHQCFRSAAVYLNGTYWGMYALGEAMDADWVSCSTGAKAEDAAMLRVTGGREYGPESARQEYLEVMDYIKAHPASESPENLAYLTAHIDAEAYLKCMAVMIFLGDSDPATLLMVNSEDGRWRPVIQNNDYCLYNSAFDSVTSYTKAGGMGMQRIDNTILRELLKVDEYRELFLTELGRADQFFTAERMLGILDPLVLSVQDEMMLHWVRWCHEDYDALDIMPVKDDALADYQRWQTRVERLRNVCRRRPAFMWSFVREGFGLDDGEMAQYFGPAPASWQDIVENK